MGLVTLFIYIETGGTGGAWSRCMYSDFLKEASELLENKNYLDASKLFEEVSNKINELAVSILPDKLPYLAKFREIFLKNNEIQEKAKSDYQKQLKILDIELKKNIKNAIKEGTDAWIKEIPTIPENIQEVYDIESKAWDFIEKNLI